MRVLRMIPIAGIKPRTFKSWADAIMRYLNSMPGNILHIVFDDYKYEYDVPSKQREFSQVERVINNLDQQRLLLLTGTIFYGMITTSFK